MSRLAHAFIFVALPALFMACKDRDTAIPDATSSADAEVLHDAHPDAPAGWVGITRTRTGLYVAGAAFAPGLTGQSFSCDGAERRAGDCCFFAPNESPPANRPMVSAGPVALRAVTAGVDLATLTPEPASHAYFGYQWTTPAWSPGDMFRASAPGDGFPAFELAAPAPAPVVVSPVWNTSTSLTIAHTQDFTLHWQPDAVATTMTLYMLAEQNGAGFPAHGAIACIVPESQGQLTVPASLMTDFQPGDICASCGLYRDAQRSTDVGGHHVTLTLTALGGGGATFE